MSTNKRTVILLSLASLLLAFFIIKYDSFRIITPLRTIYFIEPNKVMDLPNRTVSNLDNWENHHFYHCSDTKPPGYLLYTFPAKCILGAHIYASFASLEGDEFSVSYSINNQEYHILDSIRRIQSAYEYIVNFDAMTDKPSTLWLKTTLCGRKGWCNLVSYSAEVYSLEGPKKQGITLIGIILVIILGSYILVTGLWYFYRLLLQKLFLVLPEESFRLSSYFVAIFFMFLLFPVLRVIFPTQCGFNRILEIFSLPLLGWRLVFLTSLFTVIALASSFAADNVANRTNESRISFLVLSICFFFGLMFFFNNTISGDGAQYYAWLRSLVIDQDLNFKNETEYMIPAELGGGVIGVVPTRLGVCIAWFPLYAATHLVMVVLKALKVTHFEADGWSVPYVASVLFISLSASFSGLVLGYKLLRRYFGCSTSLLAAVIAYLGTAIFTWTFVHPTYNHGVDFFISTLFLYYWITTLGNRSLRQWRILATILFFAVTVREQNILFGLLLVVEAVTEYFKRDKEKFRFFLFSRGYFVFLGVFLVEMMALSLFALEGGFIKNFLFASTVAKAYSSVGLQTVETILLYPTTGLLTATPLILFSLVGIIMAFYFYKKYPATLLLMTAGILLVFLTEFGSLSLMFAPDIFHFNIGARYFINVTLLFMLGLGFLFDCLAKQKFVGLVVKVLSWCAAIYYLLLNIQYQGHIISYLGEASPWKQILKQQFSLAYTIIPDVITKRIFWSVPKFVSYCTEASQHKIFYGIFVIMLFIFCVVIFTWDGFSKKTPPEETGKGAPIKYKE
jgi:hypothetical protein